MACYERLFGQRVFEQRLLETSTNERRHRKGKIVAIAVVIPGRFGEPSTARQIYARRRLMALLVLAAIVLVLLVGTGHVVANRGGAPASAPMIRPANPTASASSAATNMYVVQAGDTMWSIGQRFHGDRSLAAYVDQLIADNGGTEIQVSQALSLP